MEQFNALAWIGRNTVRNALGPMFAMLARYPNARHSEHARSLAIRSTLPIDCPMLTEAKIRRR